IGMNIYNQAYGLGFHRKDRMDSFILFANTAVTMINTFLNLAITAFTVTSGKTREPISHLLLSSKNVERLGVEHDLAERIYQMMMPGSFFTGYFMLIVMGGMVPFVVNSLLMKIIYVWRCFPEFVLQILKVFLPFAPASLTVYPS
ncbi:unnamed protein product, partial [Polarella glacialis]